MLYTNKTEFTHESTDKFRILGRSISDETGLHFTWSNNGIEFAFKGGDRINIHFGDYNCDAPVYVKVYVDGKTEKHCLYGKDPKIVIDGLDNAKPAAQDIGGRNASDIQKGRDIRKKSRSSRSPKGEEAADRIYRRLDNLWLRGHSSALPGHLLHLSAGQHRNLRLLHRKKARSRDTHRLHKRSGRIPQLQQGGRHSVHKNLRYVSERQIRLRPLDVDSRRCSAELRHK